MSQQQHNQSQDQSDDLTKKGIDGSKKAARTGKNIAKQGAKIGRKAGSKAGRAVGRKAMKMAAMAAKKATLLAGKAVVGVLSSVGLPVLLIGALLIIVIFAAVLIFDLVPSVGDKTEYAATNTNKTEETVIQKDGKSLKVTRVTEVDGINKTIEDFFKNLTQRGYWVVDPDDEGKQTINDYIVPQLLTPQEFQEKHGGKDYYNREGVLGLNGHLLFSFDKYVWGGKWIYPEHFLQAIPFVTKPDPSKEHEYLIRLSDVVDEEGNYEVFSREYNVEEKKFEKKLVPGVWDYGIATVYKYRQAPMVRHIEGSYHKEDYWDKEEGKMKQREIKEDFRVEMEGYPIDVWLLDQAVAFSGNYVYEYEETEEVVSENLLEGVGSEKEDVTKVLYKEEEVFVDLEIYERDENGEQTGETVIETWSAGVHPFYKYRTGKVLETGLKPVDELPVSILKRDYKEENNYDEADEDEKERMDREIEKLEKEELETFLGLYGKYFQALVPEVVEKFNYDARSQALNLETDLASGSSLNSQAYKNALKWLPLIKKYADQFGVNPYLLLAQATQESAGNPTHGAGGLFEITWHGDNTISATDIHGERHTLNPAGNKQDAETNIQWAVMRLKSWQDKLPDGDPIKAIQIHNFNPRSYFESEGLLEVWEDPNKTYGWLAHMEEARDFAARVHGGFAQNYGANYSCMPEKEKPKVGQRWGDPCYIPNILRYYDSASAAAEGYSLGSIDKGALGNVTAELPSQASEGKDGKLKVDEGGYIVGQKPADEPTYVKGHLLVNKLYPLPADFDPTKANEKYPNAHKQWTEAWQAVSKMSADASRAGAKIVPFSHFRSYDYQKNLYDKYKQRDGVTEADRYSARPGYSEHQSGLAFDFGDPDNTSLHASFDFYKTNQAKWLAANAHKYGFILRFPEGKEHITGYRYESWHFRYVGVETATEIFEKGLTLEEYLGVADLMQKDELDPDEVGISVESGTMGQSVKEAGIFAKIFGIKSRIVNEPEEFERFTFSRGFQGSTMTFMLDYAQSHKERLPLSMIDGYSIEDMTTPDTDSVGNNGDAQPGGTGWSYGGKGIAYRGSSTLSESEKQMLIAAGLERPARTGVITSDFSPNRVINGVARPHAGTDVGIPQGTPLYAVQDGVIGSYNATCPSPPKGQWNGADGGCFVNGKGMGLGNFVQIEIAGGFSVIYGHMSTIAQGIQTGAQVKKGDIIGWSGNSGNSTGPHLHFELRKPDNTYVNPRWLVEFK